MLRLLALLFLCTSSLTPLFAQNSDSTITEEHFNLPYLQKTYGLSLGYRGIKNSFLEVGLNRLTIGHGAQGMEITYLNNICKQNISGFSLSLFKAFAYFEIGLNNTLFSNYQNSAFYTKPYFSAGIGGFLTAGYGYNIPLSSNHFKSQINMHEIRIIGRLPFNR